MNNDNKILELRKKLDEKKKMLIEPNRGRNKTNLKQEILSSLPSNLNIMNINQLKTLKIFLGMFINNGGGELLTDSGYKYEDLLVDIESILLLKEYKEKEKEIAVMENRLNSMLSENAKTAIAIEEIEKML